MISILDSLVMGSAPKDMTMTEKTCEDSEKRRLLLKKDIYPYECFNNFEKFVKTGLPAKEEFSKLAGKGITDEECAYAKKVWTEFGCKSDYRNLYVKTADALLADVFENFRKVCSPLLHSTRSELGWAAEKDRHRAGALDQPGHAPIHRKRQAGWTHQAEQIYHVLGREQLVRP